MKYYPEVEASPDIAKIEKKILEFWKKNDLFKKSIENRKGAEEFIFYDGPPFANGLPHFGHVLTGYAKDVFARYQTMKGKRVERRFGWDCHGLPAEMAAEKELSIKGKQDIESYGISKFNDYCRQSVMKYANEWEDYVTRQARWVDFKNDYKTMNTPYMESVMWAFKELYKKGLVYESYRVMPYSWAMETPLSNFETRLDNAYREREDKAVTVAFTLDRVPDFLEKNNIKECRLLAWTTTPWTLPSNLALGVSSDVEYVCVVDATLKGEGVTALILSKKSSEKFGEEYKIIKSFKGKDLVGLSYKPLFPYFKDTPNAFRILEGDFISDEDGTGIVHLAPGFGEDDERVCSKNGIEVICPVDSAGKFTDEIFDIDYSGNPLPLEGRGKGRGYNEETHLHAQELRKNPTEAEKKLWHRINQDQLGVKFRRQQPIGNYIVDFYSSDASLIIELDGGQHAEQAEYDKARSDFLESQGYKVVRFWNNDVIENIEGVIEYIMNVINTPSPTPPLKGEGLGGASLKGEGLENATLKGEELKTLSLKGLNVIAEPGGSRFGLANDLIIKYLKNIGLLIDEQVIKHNYPHCWRTDTPLIYKAVPSWYIEVTKIKDRMVELNQQINWIPSHVRDGLFGKWLENARDWSISRNRFWGAPIPIWKSDNPDNKELYVFGSIKELEDFFGTKIKDLHKPYIDELTRPDPNNTKYTIRRVPDVFDCWFESGSMPFAQVHYPFENKEWFETHFPADFIVEYAAQTRGWFYTLMVLGTALFDKPPFLNCICHGVILDDKGQKLSKRLNNYTDPKELFQRYGADSLRWFMMSSPVMRGLELLIDKDANMVRDTLRLAIKPIWNAYNFFTLYANADGVQGSEVRGQESGNIMDRYILSKCRECVEIVTKSMDLYDTTQATRAIEDFFEVLNNWYIRRNRKRFWKSEKDQDKQDAYDTLYTVLVTMCRLSAPLLPMITEEIWQGIEFDPKYL